MKQLLLSQVNNAVSCNTTDVISVCYILYKKTWKYVKCLWAMCDSPPIAYELYRYSFILSILG